MTGEKTISDVLSENLRLRLAHLATTWEELATRGGETPANVRGWVRLAQPNIGTLERLARLLGVPPHTLLDPDFDPKDWEPPVYDAAAQPTG
jgi:hypothetical protein